MSVDDVGLVVDPHIVFEHIYSAIEGKDFMDHFLKCYKLKIDTITQGLAMTSFERSLPKLLSSGSAKVIKDDASYLDKVSTWEDWDYPETGLRQILKDHLEDFAVAHQQLIDDNLDTGSSGYLLANLSVVHSVAIIEELIKYTDDFVKELTKAKFSFKKAFHVTTRLLRRILIEMYVPRQGVIKSFKAGRMEQIGGAMLYATVQSLQIGLKF